MSKLSEKEIREKFLELVKNQKETTTYYLSEFGRLFGYSEEEVSFKTFVNCRKAFSCYRDAEEAILKLHNGSKMKESLKNEWLNQLEHEKEFAIICFIESYS